MPNKTNSPQLGVFIVIGQSPMGWKVTDGNIGLVVQGSEKNARWVREALNKALDDEEKAFERGG